MPRFGTKFLLISVAIISMWLTTFSWPDAELTDPGFQIRKALLLVIFVSSGAAAVCYRGRVRAFWSAFFATLLLLSVDILNGHYIPDCFSIAADWSTSLRRTFGLTLSGQLRLTGALWHGLVLGIAAVSGLVAMSVYNHSCKAK